VLGFTPTLGQSGVATNGAFFNPKSMTNHTNYHNPSLGLATKARVCKVASQEGS